MKNQPVLEDIEGGPSSPKSVQSARVCRGSPRRATYKSSGSFERRTSPNQLLRSKAAFENAAQRGEHARGSGGSSGLDVPRSSGTPPPQPANPLAKDAQPKLRWKKGKFLGAGAFGKVWLGLNLDTGMLMAVKSMDFSARDRDVAAKLVGLQQEIRMMKGLSHDNIVSYYCTERVKTSINIFMEFVPGGSISALLKEFGSLSEATVRNYSVQILCALEYLHANDVVHRDVKPANILIKVDGVCKLSDFGTAAFLEDMKKGGSPEQEPLGTPAYMAPEVIRGEGRVGRPCDVWSLGATVMEMLTAKTPFSHVATAKVQLLQVIADAPGCPPMPACIEDPFKSFILWCLQKVPQDRPTCTELLGIMQQQIADDSLCMLEGELYGGDLEGELTHCGSTSFNSSPSFSKASGYRLSSLGSPARMNSLPLPIHTTHASLGVEVASTSATENLDVVSFGATEYNDASTHREDACSTHNASSLLSPESQSRLRPLTLKNQLPPLKVAPAPTASAGAASAVFGAAGASASGGASAGPAECSSPNGSSTRRPPGLDLALLQAQFNSRRSNVGTPASTIVGSRGRHMVHGSPLHSCMEDEATKIGRHLVGSCINLMSIVPEMDAEECSIGRCSLLDFVEDEAKDAVGSRGLMCGPCLSERDIMHGIAKAANEQTEYVVSRVDSPMTFREHAGSLSPSSCSAGMPVYPSRGPSPRGSLSSDRDPSLVPVKMGKLATVRQALTSHRWNLAKTITIGVLIAVIVALVLVITLT